MSQKIFATWGARSLENAGRKCSLSSSSSFFFLSFSLCLSLCFSSSFEFQKVSFSLVRAVFFCSFRSFTRSKKFITSVRASVAPRYVCTNKLIFNHFSILFSSVPHTIFIYWLFFSSSCIIPTMSFLIIYVCI